MVKQQCLFGTLLFIKVPGRHFLVSESWRKGVKTTEQNRQSGEKEERIIEIEIERLRPFKEHPFQVKDDKEMSVSYTHLDLMFIFWMSVQGMIILGLECL